jgi:hypothetical protein
VYDAFGSGATGAGAELSGGLVGEITGGDVAETTGGLVLVAAAWLLLPFAEADPIPIPTSSATTAVTSGFRIARARRLGFGGLDPASEVVPCCGNPSPVALGRANGVRSCSGPISNERLRPPAPARVSAHMYPRSAAGTGARLRCGGRSWMRQTFSVGLVEIDGPGVRRLRACDPLPLQPPHARPSSLVVHSVCCVGAGRHHPDVGIVTDRARLASRIEVEARAFANADATTRNL